MLDFGLTRTQAKVYIAIARLRLAPVGQISKASKVRREDVYRILPKLEKMGLVERLLGTPTRMRATPVEEALSVLVKHEEDTARERVSVLKAKTKTFLKHFERAPRLELEEKTHFALLSKRESIMTKMLTMMKKAEKEFDIVFSRSQITQFIHTFADQLEKIVKKGVRIRIITEVPEYEDSLPRIMEERVSSGDSVDLRYTYLPSSHYMIVDFAEALISPTAERNMTEISSLWTNSDSLVGVFQGDFENLWHNSISWKTIETNAVPEKIIGFMEQLRPTNHVIFVYDNPEAKYNVLFNYLKVGLEKGEAGVYVATDENPSQIREAMKRFGVNVEKYEKTNALHILGSEDIYIIDGKFAMTTTMNMWNKLYNEALKRGFEGLRATGEMACFFKHNLIRELIEYEKALHRTLDIPMIAICAYNANMLNRSKDPINLYSELSRAHGTVLFTGLDAQLGRMEIRKI
ncbi:MAG: MEDS domain-containing protein [Candidatus Bathyarchaeota archaeon]|nr:MAG: MEDS domain-containing protein [Candidatus Bathyarchaeota archaeon]